MISILLWMHFSNANQIPGFLIKVKKIYVFFFSKYMLLFFFSLTHMNLIIILTHFNNNFVYFNEDNLFAVEY